MGNALKKWYTSSASRTPTGVPHASHSARKYGPSPFSRSGAFFPFDDAGRYATDSSTRTFRTNIARHWSSLAACFWQSMVTISRQHGQLKMASLRLPPLFSAEADDEDEKWVRATRGGRQSDAILSCPCCLEILTIDCQKHAARDDQWRAMFVRNVRVETSVAFRPASSARSESGKGKGDRGADIRPPDLEESDGPYFRALCDTCGTPVGVRDTDEVYHFFNAFPTNA